MSTLDSDLKTDKSSTKTPTKEEKPADSGITGKEHEKANRMVSFKVRTVTTLLMLGALVLVLSLGHSYTASTMIFLLVMCFKELKALKRKREQEHNIPWFNLINWYFFF